MIRVLHTIDTTGPGGAETVFVNLAKGLDSDQFESVVAIRGPGWVCDTLRSHGIEPIFVQSRGSFNIAYLRELVRIVSHYNIDVIQAHLFGASLYSCLAGMICRIPVISTIHGFVDTNDKERLMWLKTKLINLGSKKIVFVSNRLREHFVNNLGFSKKKAITIYNGVDTSVFYPKRDDSIRKQYGIESEHIVIGAVGNIRPAKGYDIFLKAAKLVHDMHPECRFVVAGQGSGKLYDELTKLRRSLGLEEIFHFVGFQSDAAKVFNNFDIFILPSISEGFSISTIEAMACNLPIIATRCGGPEEIIVENSYHRLVDLCPKDIFNSISSIINKFRIKGYHVSNKNNYMNKNFSLISMIRNYENIYF